MDPLIMQALFAAEILLLLTRQSVVLILVKKESQRKDEEQAQVAQGLGRSLFMEIALFVPLSVILFWSVLKPFVLETLLEYKENKVMWASFLGMCAYGFPFASVRTFITRLALNTLKEFKGIKSDV